MPETWEILICVLDVLLEVTTGTGTCTGTGTGTGTATATATATTTTTTTTTNKPIIHPFIPPPPPPSHGHTIDLLVAQYPWIHGSMDITETPTAHTNIRVRSIILCISRIIGNSPHHSHPASISERNTQDLFQRTKNVQPSPSHCKELNDIETDADSQIFCQSRDGNDGDLTNLRASFVGPPDTPYEGGTSGIQMSAVRLVLSAWTPWAQPGLPVLTIRSVLLSLQSLLCTPEPKDPQDAEVANMLLTQPDKFRAKARDWAIHYAMLLPSPNEEARQEMIKYQGYNKALVDRFVVMGFDVEKVVEPSSSSILIATMGRTTNWRGLHG
ncbi:hypothetical protein EYC84_007579 [Monilinia fructicola]|uniref:UBC core domain-containing protein n=1 Tax=Monilinia fructicola TaxID=38448 RepID=A0A5M9JIT1_MONFR|nr:hypothetical protein EYC84_007579 [Monilinia fructicola]